MHRLSLVVSLLFIVFALGACSDEKSSLIIGRDKNAPIPIEELIRTSGSYHGNIPEDAGAIMDGAKAIISEETEVYIFKDTLLSRASSTSGYPTLTGYDSCFVVLGGLVTVVEVREKDLLVNYTALGDTPRAQCRTGVRFILAQSDFIEMTEQYIIKLDAYNAERELVIDLLEKESFGEVTDAGDEQLVKPVAQRQGSGFILSKEPACHIGRGATGSYAAKGGTIQVRGKGEGRILYEYTAHERPRLANMCPSGVIFLK